MADPMLFQKTLQDLIKGIRSHRKDPSAFVSKAIAEIKDELRSNDPFLKAEAVRKLTYLQMVGYNVSWAAFSIVEVMSQPRFAHKRIGYLAANQTFDDSTDVILLTTNLFKKEFTSSNSLNNNQYEVGMAVNCLANIATKELARDCISDLVSLMNHSKPYIRKKAILAMYKLYIKFPQGLRLTFDKLKERLDDSDHSVVSTAVNVICELSNKNPKNYLAMAPKFFKLLTTTSNNWMLIKVVKLLGSLVSEEPRLARKLLEPLVTIIKNTGAKSLQYECIFTITEALPYSRREDGSEAKNSGEVIALCSLCLRGFIEDPDQNLKYLGLVGLCNLMRSSPRSIVDHRDLILGCLNDDDVTIRTKALELLAGIASKKSLVDLVHHLLDHARRSEGHYREEIINKILWMCQKDKYLLVNDFAWYVSVLLDLAVMQGTCHGAQVADQLMEITLRVEIVRPYAVDQLLSMLLNEQLLENHAKSTIIEVLRAAAWVTGEYADVLTDIANDKDNNNVGDDEEDDSESESEESDSEIDENNKKKGKKSSKYWIEGANGEEYRSLWRGQPLHYLLLKQLLSVKATLLTPKTQIVYLQAAMKLFVHCVATQKEQDTPSSYDLLTDCVALCRTGISRFIQHNDLEVQERANTFRYLLATFQIVPLDWEAQFSHNNSAAIDYTNNNESMDINNNSSSNNLLDLMSLMIAPVYDAQSIRLLDQQGALKAIQQKNVLQAIIREPFYAVHHKAQRKVPVPENLTLTMPFNASAITKLVKTPLPEELSLATLTFVKEKEPLPNFPFTSNISTKNSTTVGGTNISGSMSGTAMGGSNKNVPDARVGNALDDIFNNNTTSTINTAHAHSSNNNNNADDVFILKQPQNRLNQELMPLSKLLGEFEEIPSTKHKKASKKKEKKTSKNSKNKHNETHQVEMLPAGAADSDADSSSNANNNINNASDKKKSSKMQNNAKKISKNEDASALDSIDITTPLGENEVLPVMRHRVVPPIQQPTTISEVLEKKKERTEKSSKKDKEKSHKNNNNSKKKSKEEESDLLGLDWPSSSSSVMNNHNNNNVSDLLSLDAVSEHVPFSSLEPLQSTMPLEEKKSSKREQPMNEDNLLTFHHDTEQDTQIMWSVLYTSQDTTVRYGVRPVCPGGDTPEVDILFETVSLTHNNDNATVVEAELQSHVLVRHYHPVSRRLRISTHTTNNNNSNTNKMTITLTSLQALYEASLLQVTCVLHVTQPERHSVHTSQLLTIPASLLCFTSYPLSSDTFADKIARVSSKWARHTVTLSVGKKTSVRHAFERVALLLNATLCDDDNDKVKAHKKSKNAKHDATETHSVSQPSLKAVSMACKCVLDHTRVFVLCKSKQSGTCVAVDIKCLGHNSEAQARVAVQAVVTALELETFP